MIENQPTIYNGPTLYNGDGSVYNGHGVYNMGGGGGNGLIIGGREYKTVEIGSQIWMAENLDYKFSGCNIGPGGTPSTPAAWYYNNNEAAYGIDGTYKCGLLYNWYAANYIENNLTLLGIPDGWHVPNFAYDNNDDFRKLLNELNDETYATKIKAKDNSITSGFPLNWGGTDESNLSILPAGCRYSDFSNINYNVAYWYKQQSSSWSGRFLEITRSGVSYTGDDKYQGHPIRLVKNIE